MVFVRVLWTAGLFGWGRRALGRGEGGGESMGLSIPWRPSRVPWFPMFYFGEVSGLVPSCCHDARALSTAFKKGDQRTGCE